MKRLLTLVIILLISNCLWAQKPIDPNATPETEALCANLKRLAQQGFLFGHHEDEAYGLHWNAVPGKSDVKDVCGSYPAVHGWDVGKEGRSNNVDNVDFSNMKQWIREVYERGGINTISWHVENPVTSGGAWDTTRAVASVLPGGAQHAQFLERLDHVAAFLASCKSGDTYIPIIFRPWHEHNGGWFWWGRGHCTEKEYINLWRFTVDYLRQKKGLHHILYAFSPDRSRFDMRNPEKSYLYGWPGDDYVDIIGYDNYMDFGIKWNKKSKQDQITDIVTGLRTISRIAREKNKVAALTETGLEGLTDAVWFTSLVLEPIKANKDIQLAYVMVWRNANEKHHYAPYPGHPSVADFIGFYNDPLTLFEADLQNVYKAGATLIKR